MSETKYRRAYNEQAYKLCLLGATKDQLADFFEVARSVVYDWIKRHKGFAEAVARGAAEADARVAESLFRRALGYEHEDVYISNYRGEITITPIKKHYPPDTTACIFWLKNRQSERWRDVNKHEVHYKHHVVDLTDDELANIATGGGERAPQKKNGSSKVH